MRPRQSLGRAVVWQVVIGGLLAVLGVSPALGASPVAQGAAATTRHSVVALGDSVPSGAHCACRAFPRVYASLLRRRTGGRVSVTNDARSGLRTRGLLAQLRQPRTIRDVRRSDIVLVTIGANDFTDHHDEVVNGTCAAHGRPSCVSAELVTMRHRLRRALAEIRVMRRGRPTTVLVTGYWNVFEDGRVAIERDGRSGLRASIRLTRHVNAAIRRVSARVGVHYVDIFWPFQRHPKRIDRLLAADGNHPSAAGHVLIARTLLGAGLPRIS